MAEEEEVAELSEEEIVLLQGAHKRPFIGAMLDGIMGFERSMVTEEVPEEEEKVPVEPEGFAEYLKFYQAKEAEEEEQASEAGV